MAVLLFGCGAKTRYKTLSFFFDGVPDPEKVAVESPGKGKKAIPGETASARPKPTTHGPYAAKQCDACHERASNRLVLPIEELCYTCHTLKVGGTQWVHGPLASGGCRVCHDPHGSGYPYLLVSKPEQFCFHCHDRDSISRNEVHKTTETGCTECHDAHMADNRFLLK